MCNYRNSARCERRTSPRCWSEATHTDKDGKGVCVECFTPKEKQDFAAGQKKGKQ